MEETYSHNWKTRISPNLLGEVNLYDKKARTQLKFLMDVLSADEPNVFIENFKEVSELHVDSGGCVKLPSFYVDIGGLVLVELWVYPSKLIVINAASFSR